LISSLERLRHSISYLFLPLSSKMMLRNTLISHLRTRSTKNSRQTRSAATLTCRGAPKL
jgi:hypothetical protein